MLADMQRARMLAWELPRIGCEVEVLAAAAAEVRADAIEMDSDAFFCPDTPAHLTGSRGRWIFELLGSHTHAWRTYLPLREEGDRLLASGRFDLVYLSSTNFIHFLLGARWLKRFGVPYVVDWHDPWVKERRGAGRNLKQTAGDWLAAVMERRVIAKASGMVSVSPRYIEMLRGRYARMRPACLEEGRAEVIPFAASARDLEEAARGVSPAAARTDDTILINYAGAGGGIMRRGFELLCRSLALLRKQAPELTSRVRLRLHGTSSTWRPGEPKFLEEIARQNGIGDLVTEEPARVSYRQSLEMLLAGDAAIVLGVDDPGYMPSKLFNYALSGKPLLGTARRDSAFFAWMNSAGGQGIHTLWFGPEQTMPVAEAVATMEKFLEEAAARRVFDRTQLVAEFSEQTMARRHLELFAKCAARIS